MKHPVIFCGSAPPTLDGIVTSDEACVAIQDAGPRPRTAYRPAGDYDMAQILATLPAPWNNPPAVFAMWDSDGKSNPINVGALTCPKILVLGDTHHGLRSLSRAIM